MLSNLPIPISSFIGREKEIEEVKELLSTNRFVTLTGTGGCGKTRLAIECGSELLSKHSDGVWLVELASLADPGLVPQMVAQAFSIKEQAGQTTNQALLDSLKPKNMLLLLDNCEHVVKVCAQFTEGLLHFCPQVKVLATSREALWIPGERIYRVPSLPLPDPNRSYTAESLIQYESVRLFVEHARSVRPDFRIENTAVSTLAQICIRLDGIPLAIELAAARCRSLALEEIKARLDNRFRLLTGGSRTALPRQQTLRALIDWSYDLLNEQEKTLLCRLAVFAGGWTLEAAESVCCDDEQIEANRGGSDSVVTSSYIWSEHILDLLTSLVDKNLVIHVDREGSSRYRMLETIREYATEKLRDGLEMESIQERHWDWYLKLAEKAKKELNGPQQSEAFERLELEHDNLRTSYNNLQTAIQSKVAEKDRTEAERSLLRLGVSLIHFWEVRGFITEGRQWCILALEQGEAKLKSKARAELLCGMGLLAMKQGDYKDAPKNLQDAVDLFNDLKIDDGRITAYNYLGDVAYLQLDRTGPIDPASASEYYKNAAEIAKASNIDSGRAYAIGNQGRLEYYVAEVNYSKGEIDKACLHYKEALTFHREATQLRRKIKDIRGWANSLNIRGNIAFRLGQIEKSQNHTRRAWILNSKALKIRKDLKDKQGIASSLLSIALLVSARDLEGAICLYGAASKLREENGGIVTPLEKVTYQDHIDMIRAKADKKVFATAWDKGHAMSIEEMIKYALGQKPTITLIADI